MGLANRLLATCFAGPVNFNMEMVSKGWALAYRQYSKRYIAVEAVAKVKQVGLWQGAFINPWEWRSGRRLPPLPNQQYQTGPKPIHTHLRLNAR
jgi:endonuclease YncB( thermonuclease family)